MKNFIETMKNIALYIGVFMVAIGGCLADSESLIPTLFFVCLGALFVLLHKAIEKAQDEEK